MKDKFLYLEQFMTALEDLDKEDMYRATYVLCYYGLYREFPEEATAIDKMYVKANAKLFDGQDAYVAKQAGRGKKGGRTGEFTDEQIEQAIISLYDKGGRIPTEKAVLEHLGGTSALRNRDVWKNREKICLEHKTNINEHSEQMSETITNKTNNIFNF